MIVCVPVPAAVGVYVTEQVAELPEPERVQLAALKVPVPLLVKVTVPVGVVFVPTSVSVTVAVQVVDVPSDTVVGEQLTLVLVERFAVTATVVVPWLSACVASPPYVALIVCMPLLTADGVYVTEQVAEPPVPESVHVVELKVPGPPLLVKLTVPVGVVAVPVSVSVTVAVQVVGAPTGTVPGEQLTVVVVVRLGGSATSVVPLLPACVASPP